MTDELKNLIEHKRVMHGRLIAASKTTKGEIKNQYKIASKAVKNAIKKQINSFELELAKRTKTKGK